MVKESLTGMPFLVKKLRIKVFLFQTRKTPEKIEVCQPVNYYIEDKFEIHAHIQIRYDCADHGWQKKGFDSLTDVCVLEELLEGGKQRDTITYPNVKLTARVAKVGHTAKFIESTGVPGSMQHFSIADLINVMMATLSDESQFNKIKEGRTLQLRNFLVKAKRVVMSRHSKIISLGCAR
uniref:Uncharacterized protein n=1 Tax=Magallana gigas TaxID=29159 RepID=A0A8W8MJ35_MAGGI